MDTTPNFLKSGIHGLDQVLGESFLPSDIRDYHSGEYSAAFENIIYLRYIETAFQVKRLINIYKVRSSSYDIAIHEFYISNNGIVVEEGSFNPSAGDK